MKKNKKKFYNMKIYGKPNFKDKNKFWYYFLHKFKLKDLLYTNKNMYAIKYPDCPILLHIVRIRICTKLYTSKYICDYNGKAIYSAKFDGLLLGCSRYEKYIRFDGTLSHYAFGRGTGLEYHNPKDLELLLPRKTSRNKAIEFFEMYKLLQKGDAKK